MAGKPRKHPKVRIKWQPGRTEAHRTYALLIWTPPGHPRKSESIGYATPEEAETARERKEASLLLGVRLADDSAKPWTVGAVVDEYIDDLEDRLGEHSQYLINETKRLAYIADLLGIYVLTAVNSKRLQKYGHQRAQEKTRLGTNTKRASIKEEILAFRRAWKHVRDTGHPIPEVPDFPSLAALPEDARPERRLTEAEVTRLVAAARVVVTLRGRWNRMVCRAPGLWSLVSVLAWSGRRPIAIFAARRRDCVRVVDDTLPRTEQLMWWERDKGGRSRGWGPLTEPAYEAIRARMAETAGEPDDALLWPTSTGMMWNTMTFSRTFDRVEVAAGIVDLVPYDLRKFACTKILASVANAKVAIRFTGHKTVQTLISRYAYAEVDEAELAAARIGWTPPEEAEQSVAELRVINGGKS